MTVRNYVDNAPTITLVTGINSSATTGTLSSLIGYPTNFPYTATFDYGTATAEVVLVTSAAGAVATFQRNYDGQGAFSHLAGATFDHTAVAKDYTEANTHVNATSGVHGVVGTLVGTTDSQTLSSKTLTSPTINGGSLNQVTNFGNAGASALIGKATTGGGKTLSLQNSSGTEHLHVDDAGNLSADGAVSAATGAFTGALTSGAHSVTGNATATGTVQGATVTSTGAVTGSSLTISGAGTLGSLTVGGAAIAPLPAGTIAMFGGSAAPTGWVFCDGFAISRTGANAALFAAIGITYGAGNGSTTFNTPDFNSGQNFPRGGGILGATGGTTAHTHTLASGFAEITIGTNSVVANRVAGAYTSSVNGAPTMTTGGGGAQTLASALGGSTDIAGTLPPYLGVNFIIKL